MDSVAKANKLAEEMSRFEQEILGASEAAPKGPSIRPPPISTPNTSTPQLPPQFFPRPPGPPGPPRLLGPPGPPPGTPERPPGLPRPPPGSLQSAPRPLIPPRPPGPPFHMPPGPPMGPPPNMATRPPPRLPPPPPPGGPPMATLPPPRPPMANLPPPRPPMPPRLPAMHPPPSLPPPSLQHPPQAENSVVAQAVQQPPPPSLPDRTIAAPPLVPAYQQPLTAKPTLLPPPPPPPALFPPHTFTTAPQSNPADVGDVEGAEGGVVEAGLLPLPKKPPKGIKRDVTKLRLGGGQVWQDHSLEDWDPNDFRIFVGDLGNDVNDDLLARTFSKYPSFLKAKVIRDKWTKKTKGYGFVSFKDPHDFIQAMREMNGRYVGNRPMKLRKSTWKERNFLEVKKKEKTKKRLGFKV